MSGSNDGLGEVGRNKPSRHLVKRMIKVLSKLLLLSLRMRIGGQRPTDGFADAVSRLKMEAQIYMRHRSSVEKLVRTLTDRGGLRLNLGCGANLTEVSQFEVHL
jgi:hypothetical protein